MALLVETHVSLNYLELLKNYKKEWKKIYLNILKA